MVIKRDKKEEEDDNAEVSFGRAQTHSKGGNPYQNVDKTSVLQEARTFNDTPVNPRKCTPILTKILYLLNQGEALKRSEATETFFAMTKLFQSKNAVLRRMVYLGIKELSSLADDVIIVTSSLTKDMTGKEDLYRAPAIRALCSITDGTMLQTIERYMKQAIVDKNSGVASAALVSSLHLSKVAPDVVKRWANEAHEAINSDSVMVQYHALGVLYHIRKSDRLAVTKLVAKLTRLSLRSPFAVCLLIRIACKLIEEEGVEYSESGLFEFVESCLRHKSETVIYEAAAAIVNLSHTTARQIAPAVSVLQLFCSSPKPALRFAAVRTLNKVAMTHPATVTACNLDLENLITDSNRSIATLAITTLLKTGAESAVDRLMKQIASFVSEISDEFKVVVVQAIRALCLKFPRKHATLMTFLSAMLRDEGGLDYKASIADTIITIIEDNPDAKETGLAHLCEFIEDCEHTSLAVRILHLLGREGPNTKQPTRYIRFIYNRVILENALVRAAAVSALAQFGAASHDLLPNILVLLARCQMDSDDEVRDRATYFLSILLSNERALVRCYIVEPLQLCLPTLEHSLVDYLAPHQQHSAPFDIATVPLAPIPPTLVSEDPVDPITTTPHKRVVVEESYMEKLSQVAGLGGLPGPLFKSSAPVDLTESETEYVVRCIKHTFQHHLLLQFECLNTLNDQLLENVYVDLEPGEGYRVLKQVSIPRLPYNETHSTYVLLQFPDQLPLTIASFGATLKFVVKDCDPNTGIPDTEEGYDDEYMLEEVEVSLSDSMQKVLKASWSSGWEELGGVELEDTYTLASCTTLEQALHSVIAFLGMMPHDRSDKLPHDKSSHILYLAGVFRGGVEVYVRAKLALSVEGVTMQLTVRSQSPHVAHLITSIVG